MYIYQDGKLYVQDGELLLGVSITPFGNTIYKEEKAKLGDAYSILTPSEVRAKFQIDIGNSYEFPLKVVVEPKVEVKKDDSVGKAKTTTRKPTSK